MTSAGPEPGWYLDPDNNDHERYWNGDAWTEHRRKAIYDHSLSTRTENVGGRGDASPGEATGPVTPPDVSSPLNDKQGLVSIDAMELYRLVQAQQHELARLPTGQPVSRSFLDRLAIGVAVPLSPFAAEIAKDAAILYASAQLYQLGQRLEDREMGVPELYRYPREVRKRVRAAYPALKAEMRRQEAEKRRQEKEERQRHEQLLTQKYGKRWQTHGKKWWQV